MNTSEKLQSLRRAMKHGDVAAYLLPVHDEYMNEYPPACARRVEWLSGFSGSAGMLVILGLRAALFVDGRYTLQAAAEIDASQFELHNSAALAPEAWLAKQLHAGQRVGYDPALFVRDDIRRMQRALDAKSITLAPVGNYVDSLWADRPVPPSSKVFAHEREYSGEDSSSKRRRVSAKLRQAEADAAIIAAPDSVNWLLNIRGSDVDGAPLALAPVILYADGSAQLFIEPWRGGDALRAHIGDDVEWCEPKLLEESLAGLSGKRVLCSPKSVPEWYALLLMHLGAKAIEGEDPCLLPKAMKNPVELEGIRNAHLRDGLALVRLWQWLESEIKRREITEMEVAAVLEQLRARSPMFRGASFSTIAGSGPNGAIVHYRATEKTNRVLHKGELLLLDSGGQYPDGTTDVTRTIALGKPSAEHKERYTRVLKGHIALANARFPEGTAGSQIDMLARQFLWLAGLDYDHGTGHGVGCYLNVHEGPQRIGKRGGDAALMPGMVVSNEPGYYKAGEYGIRIENLVAVMQKDTGEGGKMILGFETLTCAPIDTAPIDAALLSPHERDWINAYHAWVEAALAPMLEPGERPFLAAKCAAI